MPGIFNRAIFNDAIFNTAAGTIEQSIEGGGLNSFRVPRKSGRRPRYWWEADPRTIPDEIPLPDSLEEIQEEEQLLASAITDMVRERAIEGTIRIMRAYAEILAEQREAKQAVLAKTIKGAYESAYESEHSLKAKKAVIRKKKLMLLLN